MPPKHGNLTHLGSFPSLKAAVDAAIEEIEVLEDSGERDTDTES